MDAPPAPSVVFQSGAFLVTTSDTPDQELHTSLSVAAMNTIARAPFEHGPMRVSYRIEASALVEDLEEVVAVVDEAISDAGQQGVARIASSLRCDHRWVAQKARQRVVVVDDPCSQAITMSGACYSST